jgi:hypothetical protein
MPMPEASVNEDDFPAPGKYEVWATWNILAVHLEAYS